eukprot:gene15689-15841_t
MPKSSQRACCAAILNPKTPYAVVFDIGGGSTEAIWLRVNETGKKRPGQILYNYSNAGKHVNKDQPLIVVEGYSDVIALSEAGWKTAVAPLGTALTIEQLQLLWKRNPQPLLCEDPDSFLKSKGKEALRKIFSTPSSLVDTLWQGLLFSEKSLENADPEEKASFKKNALELIEKIEDSEVKSRESLKTGSNQFAIIEFERKEWADLGDYLLESLNGDVQDLKLALQTKGFGEGTDPAVALERWRELWQRATYQELMKKDLKHSTEDMKTSFDQKAWEKLKALKANLTSLD